MAENVEVVRLDTQPAQTSIKELRQQLKGFKDEMAGLEEGSKEFLQVAAKAGAVKHQIDEITQSVAGASADFGDMLASGTKTIQGIMGGFQAAQGALTLFGVESEEVTKAIQKMQASMAIIQGMDAIDNGIKGFKKFTTAIKASSTALKGFKGALIATGLGALVVVLGSIIANWDEFTKAIGLSEKQLNKFGEVAGGVMNVLKGSLKTLSGAITKLVTGDFKGALEQVKTGFNIKELYAEGVEQTITKREKEEQAKRTANYAKWLDEHNKAEEERLNIELEKNKRSTASKDEQLQREIEIEKERLQLYKEGSLEHEKQLTHIAQLEAKVGEDARKAEEDKAKKDAEAEAKRIEQEKKDIETLQNKYLTEEELFAADIAKKRELLQQSLDDKVVTEEEYAAISKQIDDEVTKHKETNRKKDIESERVAIQAKMNAAISMANGVANILSTIADAQDTSNKEGFEKSKKLQIASATIQMLTGIATAMAGAFTTHTGVWDIALAAVQAATIAAAGAANIAKIKSTTFNSSNVGSSASISSNAVSSTVIPPVQYSNAIQGASTEQTIGETKYYVAVTEIEKVGNHVNVAESESRY